ncbi:MAG: DNA primase [Chthoniobacterales bacterium]
MPSIPAETIEQIAAANDIVEVIGAYFPLKRAGTNFKTLCPFHQEKTPSFTVSPQRQTFHCFGCGVGGSVFRFVMEYEHIDFPAAVRKLAARVGISVVEERGASADEDRQREARRNLLRLHAEAAEWFQENLLKKQFAAPAREYLKKRGLPVEIAKNWQLGYAPDEWNAFGNWAKGRGYRENELLASGLVKTKDDAEPEQSSEQKSAYDRFRGRLMFPIRNDVGEVIAFSGRLLQNDKEGAKYLNSPETPLFRKGKVLFGLHKTKRALIEAKCAIVCEGQIDLISLFESGIKNVVAPQGTAFTESQARLLKRFVNEVVLCFDADAAGKKAAERSLEALLEADLTVRVIEMPPGEDPDSMIRTKGKAQFEKLLGNARDFFDYLIEREAVATAPESYIERVRIGRRLAETIARVPDSLLRGKIVDKAAARLNLSKEELQKLLPPIPTRTIQRPIASGVFLQVPQVIEQLCRLTLRDSDFRNFLLSQDWRPVIDQTEFGQLLGQILETHFDPSNPQSVEHLLNSADPAARPFFSHCLVEKRGPANERDFGRQWWDSLRADIVRRELKAVETRLGQPNLSTGDEVNLQKQILDLREQLRELPKLSPVPAIDI